MAYYNRGNQSGNNRDFGKPRFNRDRERSEMFSATCANCGKQCEVPFRPNGSKPVLCRDCFQNSRGSDSRRSDQRTFDRPSVNRDDNQNRPNYQAQFDELNAKMDKILELLTQNSKDVAPLESDLDEKVLEEFAGEIQEEQKEATKVKIKKEKPVTKTKKTTSSKKK